MKQRITISSYDDLTNPYYGGGGAVAIHEIAKRLSDAYEMRVITSMFTHAKRQEIIDGVTYHRVGFTPTFFPPLGQFIFLCILPFYALQNKFDVWLESFTPPYSTAFLPHFTKKPVIGLVHFLAGQQMSEKYKLPFTQIENRGIPLYRDFIVPNTTIKSQIQAIHPKANIVTISNGVHISKTEESSTKKQIGFLGRIDVQQKGLDLLLEAFAQIKLQTDWNLIIAGSGLPVEKKKLQVLLQKLHLQSRVKLLGKLNNTQKEKFFQDCAIVVVSSRHETFSLVALEALAHGKTIVAFAIPGLSWLKSSGALLSKPFDTQKFSRQLLLAMKDPSLREQLAIRGRVFAKKYSWESIALKYQDVIKGCI